jgi:AcrR family transcriptional regulator
MVAGGTVGRPRSGPRRRQGATARDEIVDAAAELFTQHGYAATSTRAIAEAVGVKQASLYYHFANKEQILFDLLLATVQPSRDVAAALARDPDAGPAAAQLWALAAYDVRLLCAGRWNLGALYLLPELRADRFAAFHEERRRLREEDYGGLVQRGVTDGEFPAVEDPSTATYLAFGLVEAVISLRQETSATGLPTDVDALAATVADAVLRLLGVPPRRLGTARRRAEAWLRTHPTPATPPSPSTL